MANGLGDLFGPVKEGIAGSGGDGGASAVGAGAGIMWFVGIIVAIALISIITAFVYFFYVDKKKWNLVTRVHYENPAIDGVSFGHGIPTRRVRFKDGRVVYLYKFPIQGYTISPELLTWTRPKEHDVIVTQDKKLFCVEGIENIDVKRKKLNVEISYPDIEMDRQDLQNYIDSKKYDDPNEKLKTIAKVSTYIFLMVTIIVLSVLAGKYYIEGKEIDNQITKRNLDIAEQQSETMESVNTFTELLDDLLPKLQNQYGSNSGESVPEINASEEGN